VVLTERYRIVEVVEVLPAERGGADVPAARPATAEPQRREADQELETAS
jgi:hypothetical protein